MQAVHDLDLATNDLGPLAWVLEELRKSMESASSALRRFVRDAALARGEDMASVDAGQLRIARQHMHQSVGALEMVGMAAPAHMLRAMESAVQQFVERPELCTEPAAAKVERAGFALTEYLEAMLLGKAVSPVALFTQYKDVQELAGADRVHPADLWTLDWRWIDPEVQGMPAALAYGAALRGRMDQAVLRIVKSADAQAGRELADIALGLAAAQSERQPKSFWKIAAGYFQGVAAGLLPADIYVKRAASRILLQYASLAKGETGVSDRLAQDLVFFCAQAVPQPTTPAPALVAVREAYALGQHTPVDYAVSPFGRFDPVLLAQARKRIGTAKESWSALSGGDASKIKAVGEQFRHVSDALGKLHPPSAPLAQALSSTIDAVVRAGHAPRAELAMEVATAVLYLEAAFQDLDPNDSQLAERTSRLAQRLTSVSHGGTPEPLEQWMEELYRRVSDRQTMGSVVGELRATLSELEKVLDQFFRDPQDKTPLSDAPNHLQQMRGVLSVLGLDQAAHAVTRMRETIEEIVAADLQADPAGTARTFERLGNNLGALGFLIDMLHYQPALAKKLFVYDETQGELRPLMGRTAPADEPRAKATAEAPATLRPAPVPAAAASAPAAAQAKPAAAAASSASGASDADDGEEELRDIFLEEAREVVQNGQAAIDALAADPSNLADLTTLRRAFHTLKGSSRMVGLTEFGEAAWSMEQVLNTWLADQKPASEELRTLSTEAMRGFARWIEDIAGNTDGAWKASMFRGPADAMRTEQRLVAFSLPDGAAAPAQPEPAEPLPELVSTIKLDLGAAPAEPLPELVSTVKLDLGTAAAEPAPDPNSNATVKLRLGGRSVEPSPQAPLDAAFELAPFSMEVQPPAADSSADTIAFELPADTADFEFNTTQVIRGEAPPAAEVPSDQLPPEFDLGMFDIAAEAPPPQAPLEIEGIDFGSLSSVSGPASAEPRPAEMPVADFAIELDAAPAAEAGLEISFDEPLPADIEAAFDLPAQPSQTAELHESPERDEQVKVIGTLRIGIPLYNVYLNEADEWSRRLATELAEWSLEMNQRMPDSAVGLAHALAGSSATVGFHALSDIARALESALQAMQQLVYGTPQHARAFTAAADEIRRLLHQFAAGFLKEPDPQVVQALAALKSLDIPQRADQPEPEEPISGFADLDFTPRASAPSKAVDEPKLRSVPAAPAAPAPAPTLRPAAETHAPASAAHFGEVQIEREDDMDVVDAVDPDLFPIFEEEGVELMPQLGGSLRQWAARADDRGARDQVLRALHTLKGSARLAGALRLGEMAHRLESAIEFLGSENFNPADIEDLLHRFDTLQETFDTLRATGGVTPAEAPAPVEPTAVAARPDPVAPPARPPVALSVVAPARAPATAAPAEPLQPVAPAKAAPVKAALAMPATTSMTAARQAANQAVRVRSQLLDRLVTQAGEVMITRSRLEAELKQLRGSLSDLTGNLDRLRTQLRDIELQAESQMQSRLAQAKDAAGFDPLEFDRFTRVQELTRMMAESVNDVATVQRSIQRVVESTEDDLIAQGRQTRELQRDLLRTRMVEFEGISDRLYRVVRLAAKETGKQVKLDIVGGNIEMDRGVLDRMTPAFEHLLRNCVAHGVEEPERRTAAGKDPSGNIVITLHQEGNDVSVQFQDDGAGLNLPRIREKALQQGMITPQHQLTDAEAANLIFMPGFSTASQVTELAGRGVGMDVVRAEVNALGGRIETSTQAGKGTSFKLVLPLTTAVTQVVMVRSGNLSIGVPANLVELVRRAPANELEQACTSGVFEFGGEQLPFHWLGALLQSSARSSETESKTLPVVIFRSAAQRVAVQVDDVLGNQEVVVKNLGQQLSRLPGLAGMTVLASGAVVLIYNPVALAQVYGQQSRELSARAAAPAVAEKGAARPVVPVAQEAPAVPLVLVVDDSITVRRVTQRLLQREGYRVALAADGLQAIERLAEERPSVVLSDIEMPRMDGFDLARNIRADVRLKDLPIVMITSRIAEKHREHAMELGVNHYLGKPYSEEELLSLVKHYGASAVAA